MRDLHDVQWQGRQYTIGVSHYADGRPGEVFASGVKIGSDADATITDACVTLSIALQYGVPIEEISSALGSVPAIVDGQDGTRPASAIGMIVSAIESRESHE